MRVAVLSDIHANLTALDAVLAAVPSVDEVWHLGDVVGYGPDPDEVVGRLRELGALGVRGNHDAAALGGREIESFNVDARKAAEWTRTAIADETRAWLAAQPETLEREGFLLVHGSPRDPIWEYITSTPVARAAMADLGRRSGPPRPHPPAGRVRRGRRPPRDDEPGLRLEADLRRPPGAAQPGQRRASRGTGSRRPAGCSWTPTPAPRPGGGPRSTSPPCRPR